MNILMDKINKMDSVKAHKHRILEVYQIRANEEILFSFKKCKESDNYIIFPYVKQFEMSNILTVNESELIDLIRERAAVQDTCII